MRRSEEHRLLLERGAAFAVLQDAVDHEGRLLGLVLTHGEHRPAATLALRREVLVVALGGLCDDAVRGEQHRRGTAVVLREGEDGRAVEARRELEDVLHRGRTEPVDRLRVVADGCHASAVGDDAQAIYGFRAATVKNILEFPTRFDGSTVLTLTQNYRSTTPVLLATNRIIAESPERYDKDLTTEREGGGRPVLAVCQDETEQSTFVIDRILEHLSLI